MSERAEDVAVRKAAFEWLGRQVEIHGNVLPRPVLELGFQFAGQRVPLVSRQGIFKPKALEKIPLSITTTPKGPYDDSFGPDGLLRYKYRGTDPNHTEVYTQSASQYTTDIVPDGTGRVIIVWQDRRYGELDIYAQRLNSQGFAMWTKDEIVVYYCIGAKVERCKEPIHVCLPYITETQDETM